MNAIYLHINEINAIKNQVSEYTVFVIFSLVCYRQINYINTSKNC